MNWQDHIHIDSEVMLGKPIVKGTRITVEFILNLLAQGWSLKQILENYPRLTVEDVEACLAYAAPNRAS